MGYSAFFWMAFACNIATIVVTYLTIVKIDSN